jgi:glutathione synthase/RimK-type ligase-like ATP-grasp enzyme
MNIPTVIINSCNPKSEKQTKILRGLKQQAIFTSYPVGNKLKVYNKVLKGKKFTNHLIPSTIINSPKDVISFLIEQSIAVMKPLSGNHGKKVSFIERVEDKFKLTDGQNMNIMNYTQLEAVIEQRILAQKFLLQPFIECKTK